VTGTLPQIADGGTPDKRQYRDRQAACDSARKARRRHRLPAPMFLRRTKFLEQSAFAVAKSAFALEFPKINGI